MKQRIHPIKYALLALCLFILPCSFALENPLPGGSYQDSCQRCTVSNTGVLSCLCRDNRGISARSFLQLSDSCRRVQNINGTLRCAGRYEPQPAFPPKPGYPDRSRRKFEVRTRGMLSDEDAARHCPRVCDRENARWRGDWRNIPFTLEAVCICRSDERMGLDY